MKRIAVFCDGTWNRSDAAHPTNVVHLARALHRTAPDGTPQIAVYVPGVGAGAGASKLQRWLDRVLGGALGWGLTRNIAEAYRHLALNHAPGDEIYIFGFSRGAYTARSLAGLIRASGLGAPANVGRIPEAIDRYRNPDPRTKPDHPDSFAFRLGFAPDTATSAAEADWRVARGHPEPPRVVLRYLGVWDTVGALGIPFGVTPARLTGAYNFHDTTLSHCVRAARHAVAIDERRRFYAPALWDNVAALNAATEGTPYRQEWFPGDHSSVGGGAKVQGLAVQALDWMREGAEAAGLRFDDRVLAPILARADAAAPLASTPDPGLWMRLMLRVSADRDGPVRPEDVSGAARRRWDAVPGYRPAPLRRVAAALDPAPTRRS